MKFDGNKNSKDLRIRDAHQKAHFYRPGDGINEAIMVTGEHKRVDTMQELNMVDDTEETTVIRDHLEIF